MGQRVPSRNHPGVFFAPLEFAPYIIDKVDQPHPSAIGHRLGHSVVNRGSSPRIVFVTMIFLRFISL